MSRYNPNAAFDPRVRIRAPRIRVHNANRMFRPRRFHNAAARGLRHATRFPGVPRSVVFGHLYHQGGFNSGGNGSLYHTRSSFSTGSTGGMYRKGNSFRGGHVGGIYRSKPRFGH